MRNVRSLFSRLRRSRELSLLIVVLVLILFIGLRSPQFLTASNLNDMLINYSVTMILSLGMMGVLLIGGIDISIGSILALSGMSAALVLRDVPQLPISLFFLIAVLVGALSGFLNAAVITWGGVPAIICTLGLMNILRGTTYLVARNAWVSAYQLPTALKAFGTGSYLSFGLLNNLVFIMLLCYVVFYVYMRHTRSGRRIYASGSNREAARVSGVNTMAVSLRVYVVMGLLCGLCGALWVSLYASAQGDMGMGIEMDVIAACVIGGVSLTGGRGTVPGVFMGALTMAILGNSLPQIGVSQFYQQAIKGFVILIAIILNTVGQRSLTRKLIRRRHA